MQNATPKLKLKLTPLSMALALMVGATLSGCSAATPEGDPAPASQTETGEDAPDASEGGADSEVPSWISDNFPIYPDSEVSTVSDATSATIVGFMIQTDDGQAVVDWYNEQYTQNGWTQNLVQNEGARFNASNSEGYMVVIGVTSMSTASVVTLTATKPIP